MTKQEFMEKFRHEWAGMVVDAATMGTSGAERALTLRFLMQKIDRHLSHMYDLLKPDTKVAVPAGKPVAPPARVG